MCVFIGYLFPLKRVVYAFLHMYTFIIALLSPREEVLRIIMGNKELENVDRFNYL